MLIAPDSEPKRVFLRKFEDTPEEEQLVEVLGQSRIKVFHSQPLTRLERTSLRFQLVVVDKAVNIPNPFAKWLLCELPEKVNKALECHFKNTVMVIGLGRMDTAVDISPDEFEPILEFYSQFREYQQEYEQENDDKRGDGLESNEIIIRTLNPTPHCQMAVYLSPRSSPIIFALQQCNGRPCSHHLERLLGKNAMSHYNPNHMLKEGLKNACYWSGEDEKSNATPNFFASFLLHGNGGPFKATGWLYGSVFLVDRSDRSESAAQGLSISDSDFALLTLMYKDWREKFVPRLEADG